MKASSRVRGPSRWAAPQRRLLSSPFFWSSRWTWFSPPFFFSWEANRVSAPGSPLETLPPAISLRNLRVSYGDREILHGVTFDVQQGETLVILGGFRSGENTLLLNLFGLERPTSGEILIKGKNLPTLSDEELGTLRRHTGLSLHGDEP